MFGPLSFQQAIAVLLFSFTGPILALDYWKNGGSIAFFGVVPVPTLLAVASIGGAISFPLFVGARRRLLAVYPGALAGFGAFGLHFLYTALFERKVLYEAES